MISAIASATGKLQRWKRFWMTGQCKKQRTLDSTNKTLGVTNFISAFILLLGGMLLSCLLLALEHVFYRYIRPQVRHLDKYECCGLVSISMGQLMSLNTAATEITQHKCNNDNCHISQWKIREENVHLRKRVQELELQLGAISNRTISDQPRVPLRSRLALPSTSRLSSSTSSLTHVGSNHHTQQRQQQPPDYADAASLQHGLIYQCQEEDISQYCSRHQPPCGEQPEEHSLSRSCRHHRTLSSGTPPSTRRPTSYIEEPSCARTYKIITALPPATARHQHQHSSTVRLSNSVHEIPHSLAQSLLKIRKRRRKNECVVKESCL